MGKKMRACLSITQNNLYKWVLNPRIYLVAVLLGAYFHSRIFPILQFCDYYQVGISPFLFPFFLSDDHVVLIVTLGAMLLFCDAPFIDLEQPYIVLRSGRKTWVWGQILYLAVASFLYTIFTFLMTLLLLLPKLELQFDWGKVIGTLVQTTTGSEFGISIPFDRYVYFGYSPMGATGISLLLCFSVVLFLGVLMFYLNLRVNRMVGTIASGLLILWQLVIRKTATVFVRLSPVSWMKLGQIDLDGSTLYPPLSYVMIGLYAMILIFCILSVLRIRKTNIDVLKSV